jgi:hypothetical protein
MGTGEKSRLRNKPPHLVDVLNHDGLDLGDFAAHAIYGVRALVCAVERHSVLQHSAELCIVLVCWRCMRLVAKSGQVPAWQSPLLVNGDNCPIWDLEISRMPFIILLSSMHSLYTCTDLSTA